MSSTIKSIVKAAREALDRHDYATGLRLSETGLAEDDKNYLLHVFRAVALQHLGHPKDAIEAYRLAASLNPNQQLAFQGWASVLESDARHEEAIEPLLKLSQLSQLDPSKNLEHTRRLLKCYERAGRMEEAITLLQWFRSQEAKHRYKDAENLIDYDGLLNKEIALVEAVEEEKIKKEVEKRRFRLGAEPLPILQEQVCTEIVSASSLDSLLFSSLETQRNLEMADKLVARLLRKIPTTKNFNLTTLLLDLADKYQEESAKARWVLDEFKDYDEMDDSQIDHKEDEALHSLALSVKRVAFFWSQKDLMSTMSWIKKSRERIKANEEGYGFKYPKTVRWLKLIEGLLLAEEERWEEAKDILRDISNPETTVIDVLIKCHIETKEYAKGIELSVEQLDRDSNNLYYLNRLGWLYFLVNDIAKAKEHLEHAERLDQTNAQVLFNLGRVYWEEGKDDGQNGDKCLEYFLKSVQMDSNWAEPYLYLGKYYNEIGKDRKKGEKCFGKALQLDPLCLEAALELSTYWISLANRNSKESMEILPRVIQILEPFKEDNYRSSRLWMNLGIVYEALERYSAATTAFQNALKGHSPDEFRCLLGLAESYRAQKRFAAAIKAYNRALDLRPGCQTALYGLAAVDAEIGHFESAVDKLKLYPSNAWIQASVVKIKYLQLTELIKDACVKAALRLARDIFDISKGQLKNTSVEIKSMFWKVLSDTCMALFPLEKILAGIENTAQEMMNSLFEAGFDVKNEIWSLITSILNPGLSPVFLDLIKISSICQINLIIEQEDESLTFSAWTDLALVLFHGRSGDHGADRNLLLIVKDCAQQGLGSGSPTAFTMLGLAHLCLEEYGLAQHYLIAAVKTDAECQAAWLSLAHLYNILGDLELARFALSPVQLGSTEDSAAGWVFQCRLAKQMSDPQWPVHLRHAAQLVAPSDHATLVLNTLVNRPEGPEDLAKLKLSLLYRHAFVPNDQINNYRLDQYKSLRLDDYYPDYVEVPFAEQLIQQDKPMETLRCLFNSLDVTLFCHRLWRLFLDLWPQIKDFEGAQQVAEDWLRMRITLEMAERIFDPLAIQCIRLLWGDKLPEEISTLLRKNELFVLDS